MTGPPVWRRSLTRRFAVVCLTVLSTGGCALGTAPFAAPEAEAMPGLEAQADADPTDIDVVTRLAAGHAAGGRLDEALAVLERGLEAVPNDPTLTLMLGLVEAELGLNHRAARRFATYLATVEGHLSEETRTRLHAVLGPALEAEAAAQLAAGEGSDDEDEDPHPNSVVVLPADASADDRATATSLSWLLGRELARARFRVEDRRRVAAYLAARGTTARELSELSTGLEMARLLDVRHVVQGRLSRGEGDEMRWDVTVVSVLPDGSFRVTSLPIESSRADVLRAARAVSASARRAMEGQRLELPLTEPGPTPPGTVEALSAFGQGLLAVDADAWESALDAFELARDLDPGLEEATRWARQAGAVVRLEGEPLLTGLEKVARIGESDRAVIAVRRGPHSTRAEAFDRLSSRHRADVPEVLGLDRLLNGALLSMVLETAGPGEGP